MSKFFYKAITPEGKPKTGTTVAKNEAALKSYLESQNLSLVESKILSSAKGGFSLNFLKKVSLIDKLFFTQNLQVMVRSGFSLSLAIGTLAKQTKNIKFRDILLDIKQDVESGISFADSLAKYPKVFSAFMINMVRAGEASGQLDRILLRVTIQLKKDHNLVSKLKGALIYPIIILIGMVGIGIFMMVFVIPKITVMFTEVNAELPMMTKLLIGTSNFMAKYFIFIVIAAVALFIVFSRFIRSKRGKHIWHNFLIKLPIFSTLIKKINLARFTRGLSSLLKSDIPIVETFNIIASTMSNVHYQDALIEAGKQLKKGESIVTALEKRPRLFPPVVTQMISVGEESGTLDTISEEIAVFYEEDVDQSLANLSTTIEPVLMIILGVAVGGIAVAVIMPMYSLVNQF